MQEILTIVRESLHIEKLKTYFGDKTEFHLSEIGSFYKRLEQNIKRATLDWRIYELKNMGVLHRVGRGYYSLTKGIPYLPDVSNLIKILFRKINKQFPYLKLCLWNTRSLNEFMVHQPGRFYQLVEVEIDAMESVFFFLKEQQENVFLNPTKEILNKYAIDKKEIIVVTHLITESPIQTIDKIPTVTLEKILVDTFCDDELFGAQQGTELKNIFCEALVKYIVDESKLLRYAARRTKKEEIQNFIKQFSKKRH